MNEFERELDQLYNTEIPRLAICEHRSSTYLPLETIDTGIYYRRAFTLLAKAISEHNASTLKYINTLLRALSLNLIRPVVIHLIEDINGRIDSHASHPWLVRMCRLRRFSRVDAHWKKLRALSRAARKAEDNSDQNEQLGQYLEIAGQLEQLSDGTPPSHLWFAIYTLILTLLGALGGVGATLWLIR